MKLTELAKLAGVSPATASLALNDKPGINEQTKQHVIALAEAHNYKRLRKPKRKRYDKTIRIVFANTDDYIDQNFIKYPVIKSLLENINNQYEQLNCRVITSNLKLKNLINQLTQLEDSIKSDTLLIMGTGLDRQSVIEIRNQFANCVFIDCHYPNLKINSVSINNYLGGQLAAKHLIANKHYNIGYIKGDLNIQNFQQRFEGFTYQLHEHNLQLNPNYILSANNFSTADGVNNFKVTDRKQLPTAFFCENDYIAQNAIDFFTSQGLRIPQDISIIGFDGIAKYDDKFKHLTSIYFDPEVLTRGIIFNSALDNNGFQLVINPQILELDSVKKR